MCLALRASGLWLRYATLQIVIPSFPWIAPPRPPPWRNPRKGRDQILPFGNLVSRDERYIITLGTYKPRMKCYDVRDLGMKFERCFDSEAVAFDFLSDDYSKLLGCYSVLS